MNSGRRGLKDLPPLVSVYIPKKFVVGGEVFYNIAHRITNDVSNLAVDVAARVANFENQVIVFGIGAKGV